MRNTAGRISVCGERFARVWPSSKIRGHSATGAPSFLCTAVHLVTNARDGYTTEPRLPQEADFYEEPSPAGRRDLRQDELQPSPAPHLGQGPPRSHQARLLPGHGAHREGPLGREMD